VVYSTCSISPVENDDVVQKTLKRHSQRAVEILRREDLEGGSFYELLREHGVALASGSETIEPTVTTPEEADILGVPVHAPAFLFERLTRDDRGRPVEFVRSVYRGDRYRLELELRPPGD